MKRKSSPARLSLAMVLVTAGLAAGTAVATRLDSSDADGPVRPPAVSGPGAHWVGAWGAVPERTGPGGSVPAGFTGHGTVFADTTLRQTVRVSIGGRRIRLRFANTFGGADLPITAVTVARPAGGRAGAEAIVRGSARPLTFGGRPGTDIPVGAEAVSDPLYFDVLPGANLTVTVYLSRGIASSALTSHPGSRTTTCLIAGDRIGDTRLPGAATVDHWYFLNGVEVWSARATSAVALLGESLTDGYGSTTDGNDRWPDRLLTRLAPGPGGSGDGGAADVAIVNEAAGGNRVLHEGVGPSGLSRLDRDVLAQPGVRWLVVFEGVNDIGRSGGTRAGARQVADGLISAYQRIVARAHARGIRVYGATITPFQGSLFDDAAGVHESARQAVNAWIRGTGHFDAVVDFDRAARDPGHPHRIRPAYDLGDHLHLNPAGYRALADAFPLRLLRAGGGA
jgi:lysophospholipase L1-like esterase